MGTISLQIPVTGQPNSTEDPKIASDFTTLQTTINGNIDTNNVSPTAGITATQLAASAQFGGSVQLTFAAPCRVHRAAVYTHGGGGWQYMSFDTVDYDPGSHFSVGTGFYTCPAAGYYQVNGQARWTVPLPLAPVYGISIFKNGSISDEGVDTTNTNPVALSGMTVSSVVSCAANDTLSVAVYSSSNTASLSVIAANNYMSVFRVA